MLKIMLRLYDLFTSMQSSSRSFFALYIGLKSRKKSEMERSRKSLNLPFLFLNLNLVLPLICTSTYALYKNFFLFLAHFAVLVMDGHEKKPYTWSFL